MNARIDLSAVPILDHHAHALVRADVPMPMEKWQGYFSESPNPLVKQRDVPHTIMWQWGIRELAGYLGCEPTAEAVYAARSALPVTTLANGMWQDTNSEALFLDYYGFAPHENYTLEAMAANFNQKIEKLLRIETFAQDLFMRNATFDAFLDAFIAGLEGARAAGHIGFKSIIAYRTGLDIGWVSRDEAARIFAALKPEADRAGKIRLADKTLCDFLVVTALEVAERQSLPFQFHTGLGDTDLDMRTANPLHMRPLFQSGRFDNVRFVMLHGSYPYTRDLGYLAAMYPNIYMDISLAIPFITIQIPQMIREALGLTPINKILYSSDAFSIPEIYWLANRWGRAALEKVLGEIVEAGALTETQAYDAGERILNRNIREVYWR
ncbi:MAG: amidohydrolase family protein [Anaerolineae bacterium]|nr:amidohydrolase family protein [Anaerolineae bacterium]